MKATEIKTASNSAAVRDVLSKAIVQDDVVILTGALDRGLYTETNKALEALGGKWNRSRKGHVFPSAAKAAAIVQAVEEGEYVDPRLNGFFPTPRAIVDRMITLAELTPDMSVLEPSAGLGAIAQRAASVVGWGNIWYCELLAENRDHLLKTTDWAFIADDFLAVDPDGFGFDRVLMNPPFARGLDRTHILHAWRFLKPGGRLVAIASAGVSFGTDRQSIELRDLITAAGGSIQVLPDDSFRNVGTGVNTVIITADKP